MNTDTKEKFRDIQKRFGFSKEELVDRFNISESTQKNYSAKKKSGKARGTRASGISKSVELIHFALTKLEEHPGVNPKKEFDALKIENHPIDEFVLLFKKDQEEHSKITIKMAIDAQLKDRELERPTVQFKKRYTHINDETLEQAVVECPDLVEKLVLDESLRPLARSHALFALASVTEDKEPIFQFVKTFINHPSPFIRETAFMGLYECYSSDSEKYSELKKLFQESLEQEKAIGIKKKISSLLESM